MIPAVRFTWNMLYDCNYRCTYCFFEGKWEEYRKKNIYLSVGELKAFWGRVYERYGLIYLNITGGEPFIYPNFIEIIKSLSDICYHINISSNSSGALNSFVEEVSPQKVSLSLSFHPQFDNLENFIQRLLFIRKHQFQGCVNLVAYPAFLMDIAGYQARFAALHEPLKIIPFIGKYQGRNYPESYTLDQQKVIGVDASWFAKVQRQGSICQAGVKTALIFPDGKVARCGQVGESMILGNFFTQDFRLLDSPLPCTAEFCPCDEDKLTLEDKAIGGLSVKISEVLPQEQSKVKPEAEENSIDFTWDSHYKCNFRCPYCWFYAGWVEGGKRNIYLSVDEWMHHWRRIYNCYGKCRIAITGGEPFLYPDFIHLVKELSRVHSVKITTNMSGDIESFIQEIDPQKVVLDLNFHPLFSDQEAFIKKVLLLKRSGFKAGVCYLAYPPQIRQIDAVRKRFESDGINFALAAFWGEYLGHRYPESYSQEDKDMIRPFLGDTDRITYHLKGQSPKGKLCNAGYKHAVIQADGKVIRCGPLADKVIGSFFDEDFRLLDAPTPCQAETCPCDEYVNLLDQEEKDS